MKVVIVNSQLKDYGGHLFHNTLSICKGLKKRDISWIIIGNRAARTECMALKNFLPYFPESVFQALEGSGVRKIRPFFKRALEVKHLLLNLFKDQSLVQERDVILVHSPREFEFLGWSLFLKENYQVFQKRKNKIIILSLIDYHRPSLALTFFLKEVYRYAFSIFSKLPYGVRVGTVSELIKLEYEKLTDLKIEVFPDLAVGRTEVCTDLDIEDEFIDITYLGGARYTKGFDLLIDTIDYLRTQPYFQDKMRFWIQSNVEPGLKVDVIEKALNKLKDLSKMYNNIKIVNGPLSTEEYYALLERGDIIILPYRAEFYKRLVSGPFVEALYFGKVPVIPEGTWMAYEASKYGLNGVTFHSGSITSLGETLLRVSINLSVLKKTMERISLLWRQYHNPDNFVRILLDNI